MQRQLQGVPDAYAPSVEAALSGGDDSEDSEDEAEVTISDATRFYLDTDPLDPAQIPNYKRNLIYSREMKWHLSIVLKEHTFKDLEWYNTILDYHDVIMRSQTIPEATTGGIPPLVPREISIIVHSRLEDYFEDLITTPDQVSIYLLMYFQPSFPL